MAKRPTKVSERRDVVTFADIVLPVRIITERRRNVRASLAQSALLIRLPAGISEPDRRRGVADMLDWARKTYADKPEVFDRFRKVQRAEAYTITVGERTYGIDVQVATTKSHRIKKVGEGQLLVDLNYADPRVKTGKVLPKLLAKYFAGVYLPAVTERVFALNEAHFCKPIHAVKLRDTYTRWGSCSSKGNINLATRLLLAPDAVMDAVIIHELAHLVQANHSPAFWAEVARALPNYQEYDAWLREHGNELLFQPTPVT